MKISGHGGHGVLEDDGGNKRFECSSYESDVEEIIDDVTDSGSGGAAEGLPIIYKVNSLSFDVVDRDDASFIIALGMTEGQVVSVWVKRGAKAGAFSKFTNTIVRNVRETNPQNAARRLTVTCEYGTYQRGVTAPTFT